MDPDQKIIYSIIERFVKRTQEEEGPVGFLIEALGIKAREVISLVGAGGKTTLMFRLAKELFLSGRKVVTTTTTKILEPKPEETNSLYIDLDEEKIRDFVWRHIDQYRHITVAQERLGSGKLKGISPNLVKGLWSSHGIDTIIIEADGAAGRPVKAPRENEPVIPTNTTLVVAILGVDGMEMELNEQNVFQQERVSKITGIPIGERLTDEAMAILMTHPEGIFKGTPSSSRVVAFLNKVDIPHGVAKAKTIAQKILEKKHRQIERVVLGQLKNDPPVAEVIFP
ncbi:MAG: selenium cofactor biosynthesis protein YqeC [Desulfobacterales bacterium]|nr:selenium cofactor biosynthesis protein YqeC [Desulfobacterales bacterium]